MHFDQRPFDRTRPPARARSLARSNIRDIRIPIRRHIRPATYTPITPPSPHHLATSPPHPHPSSPSSPSNLHNPLFDSPLLSPFLARSSLHQSSFRPSIPHAAIRVGPRGRPQTLAFVFAFAFVRSFVWPLVCPFARSLLIFCLVPESCSKALPPPIYLSYLSTLHQPASQPQLSFCEKESETSTHVRPKS